MFLFFKLLLLLCVSTTFLDADLYNFNDDGKLVLSPVELIDMVLKERRTNSQAQVARWVTVGLAHRLTRGDAAPVAQPNDDKDTLKRRKVWNRWGKWGECSVTCGSGVVSRERVCAEGRCARGEREQQRRPCTRQPCGKPAPSMARDTD